MKSDSLMNTIESLSFKENLYQSLPEAMTTKAYWSNSILDWLFFLGSILIAVILAKVVYWISSNIIKKMAAKTKGNLDDILIDKLEEPVVFAIIIAGIYIGTHQLSMSENWAHFNMKLIHILLAVNVTWFLSRFVNALIDEYLVPVIEKSESDLDDQLLPVVRKGLTLIIWVLGIIVALDNAGYDVAALLAGLGIGGLAVAMAAKDTMANFFGGVTVFADKPFKINDRIQISGYDGTVKEIGIRSTRIITLDGRQVIIPNSLFIDKEVLNVSLEEHRKVKLSLGLTYNTTPQQMNEAIEILKDIVKENQDTLEEDCVAVFTDFGDFSLGITFIYYITHSKNIFEVNHKINMTILKRFNDKNLDFAFPTQSILLEQNS